MRHPCVYDFTGRSETLFFAGMVYNARGNHEHGKALVEDGVRLLRDAGDRPGPAVTLSALGYGATRGWDYELATPSCSRRASIYTEN